MSVIPVNTVDKFSLSHMMLEDYQFVDELISSNGNIHDFASFFSVFKKSITSFYGYEIQLGSQSPADVLFCLHKPHELADMFDNETFYPSNNTKFFGNLKNFGDRWLSELKTKISNVWFEYDFDQIKKGNYVPNFFVGPSKGLHPFEVMMELDKLFSSTSSSKNYDTHKTLLACYRALPPGAWISQIGQMKARGEDVFRVFVQDIPKGEIPELLERLEYKGEVSDALLSWLDIANKYGSKVDLDLDLDHGTSPKIGLEIYCQNELDARGFLEELLRKGLCIPPLHKKMNDYLDKATYNAESIRHCFLSHFKIVYDGEAKMAAKAYLGFISDDQKSYVVGTKP